MHVMKENHSRKQQLLRQAEEGRVRTECPTEEHQPSPHKSCTASLSDALPIISPAFALGTKFLDWHPPQCIGHCGDRTRSSPGPAAYRARRFPRAGCRRTRRRSEPCRHSRRCSLEPSTSRAGGPGTTDPGHLGPWLIAPPQPGPPSPALTLPFTM